MPGTNTTIYTCTQYIPHLFVVISFSKSFPRGTRHGNMMLVAQTMLLCPKWFAAFLGEYDTNLYIIQVNNRVGWERRRLCARVLAYFLFCLRNLFLKIYVKHPGRLADIFQEVLVVVAVVVAARWVCVTILLATKTREYIYLIRNMFRTWHVAVGRLFIDTTTMIYGTSNCVLCVCAVCTCSCKQWELTTQTG